MRSDATARLEIVPTETTAEHSHEVQTPRCHERVQKSHGFLH